MKDCTAGSDCQMVLAGHSQGGAIAAVASIVYEDYSPMVATFGAPKAVFPGCSKLDEDNHYRFITAQSTKIGFSYDVVTMLTGFGSKHYGHSFLLKSGENAGQYPVYLGMSDNRDRKTWAATCHLGKVYTRRMKKVLEGLYDDSDSATISSYHNGKRCGYGDECSSKRCAGIKPPFHCRPKLKVTAKCWKNSDCLSGKCITASVSRKCANANGRLPNGQPCHKDSHCDSKFCKNFKCRKKLKKGAA